MKWARDVADRSAVAFGTLFGPALRVLAQKRGSLPRFQALMDRTGFQLRGVGYYEPTYVAADLPSNTNVERALPGIDWNEAEQLSLLDCFGFGEELLSFPLEPSEGLFGYNNDMFSFGDAEIYYSIIRKLKPRRIIEIGSGNSTLMALNAKRINLHDDSDYQCEITCIEPYEMPWLEATGVNVLRQKVETVDLRLFQDLSENDILFIDSSHVIRPWGDVLREIQEIIPSLKPGVLIQIHDIFSPRDYPESWMRDERRLWDEQYILESFLAFNNRFSIICAVNWLRHSHFDSLVRACPLLGKHPTAEPGSFWIRAN